MSLFDFAGPFGDNELIMSGFGSKKSRKGSRKGSKGRKKGSKGRKKGPKVSKKGRKGSKGRKFGSGEYGPGYLGDTSYPNGYLKYFGQDVPKNTPTSALWNPNPQ